MANHFLAISHDSLTDGRIQREMRIMIRVELPTTYFYEKRVPNFHEVIFIDKSFQKKKIYIFLFGSEKVKSRGDEKSHIY